MVLSYGLLSSGRARAGVALTAGAMLLVAGAMLMVGATIARAAEADLATLAKNLSAAELKDRVAAVDGLADLGADAKVAVPSLVGALKDKSPEVRWRGPGAGSHRPGR